MTVELIELTTLVESWPSKLVQQSLLKEVCLTPKPGLVDRRNAGAHKDMDFDTFIASIEAISQYLDAFYQQGLSSFVPSEQFLPVIRQIGAQCEASMFHATQGINTHKGGIFCFALFLSAAGKLEARQKALTATSLCQEVALFCHDMVDNELVQNNQQKTIGERLYHQYGFTGARGEAEGGYKTVREISLPVYLESKAQGFSEDLCLLQSLIYLMAYNQDTNLVSRGGIEGLQYVQGVAKLLIEKGGIKQKNIIRDMEQFDHILITKNLSPGGSADLLGLTYFLSHYC